GSSAPIVTIWPSQRVPAVVDAGSPPSAMTFTTMSRSVTMPFSGWSWPPTGRAPPSRARILRAASTNVSFSPTHSALLLMISRAFVISPPHRDRPALRRAENGRPARQAPPDACLSALRKCAQKDPPQTPYGEGALPLSGGLFWGRLTPADHYDRRL